VTPNTGPADFFAAIRVLDLTASLAGPWATYFLAQLGCEIIKVESCEHYDLTRGPSDSEDWRAYANRGAGKPFERADTFLKPNRGKLGLTLDLKSPEGLSLFKRLVPMCDVVVENFAPGQMDKFGLGFEVLHALNPRIIYAAMPSLGSSGPERDYVGYGNTVECLSGIASVTGYPGGDPMISEMWFGDPAAALHASGAIAMALLERERTGVGTVVEIAQVEGLACWLGDSFMDFALNGRNRKPSGNEDPSGSWPHGVFPCEGNDEWIAISVSSEAHRTALTQCTGVPLNQGRKAAEAALAAWSIRHEKRQAMDLLQGAGIPAAAVQYNKDLFEDPHLRERGYFESVTHSFAGTHLYPGTPWKVDGVRPRSASAAPMMGEHNKQILQGMLGLSDHEIAALANAGVIGDRPTADRWGG
jgi:crotonobetainyl-CoA:carnitine CoA-transferase CaiB-like acyl-CoA transferase